MPQMLRSMEKEIRHWEEFLCKKFIARNQGYVLFAETITMG